MPPPGAPRRAQAEQPPVLSVVTTLTYDANGNLARKTDPSGNRTTYTWDYENRLTHVALPAGTRLTFSYNADGKRVQMQVPSGTTKLLWDLENLLLETDAGDVTNVIYTLTPARLGNLISQRRSGTRSYYHFDALGSTDRLTDAAENVTDSYTYDAFGTIRVQSGATTNPYRYAGERGYYFDSESALQYLRARFYDPAHGRFLSRMPLASRLVSWSARR